MTALAVDIRLQRGRFLLDACFSCPADAITAMFGPSGAGKSTLLSALAGLRKLDSGSILFAGEKRDQLAPHRRSIGLMFQDGRLFPHLTVRQNIAYAWRRAEKGRRLEIESAARFFDIVASLDRPVNNLSGGEKSRVALARAVVAQPKFLLLDEPFSALDGQRRRAFIEILLQVHREYRLPMLIVTHSIDDATALASHLVALDSGRVIASGGFALASREARFQRLLESRDAGVPICASELSTGTGTNARALWLRADHVLLAATKPQSISARNIVEGHITAITKEQIGSYLITLQTKLGDIFSRITSSALDELSLEPGLTMWAIFKAHAL